MKFFQSDFGQSYITKYDSLIKDFISIVVSLTENCLFESHSYYHHLHINYIYHYHQIFSFNIFFLQTYFSIIYYSGSFFPYRFYIINAI